jgi:hypothetical protein
LEEVEKRNKTKKMTTQNLVINNYVNVKGSNSSSSSSSLQSLAITPAGQASITLKNGNGAFCYHNDTEWSLDKTPNQESFNNVADGNIYWTITATRGATSANTIDFNGYMSVTNTGSAPATIGNVVVNLQKRVNNKWVSAVVNVANATFGDFATTANIVAAASQENQSWNTSLGASNYTVSGGVGTFTETLASGSLQFTDAFNNNVFAIKPQVSLAPGETKNLFFQATFNNTILNLPVQSQLRVEFIVTFGNAGARGGSGATLSNVDINGNDFIDIDERNVRSVPFRISLHLPPLETCNDSVVLTDDGPTVVNGDTITLHNYTDSSEGLLGYNNVGTGETIQKTTVYHVGVDFNLGSSMVDAHICNKVQLKGMDSFTSFPMGFDANSLPIVREVPCCVGINLEKESCVDIAYESTPTPLDYCTYTQGKFKSNHTNTNPVNNWLTTNFSSLFPYGLLIGKSTGFYSKWTTITALRSYLGTSGGTPSSLTVSQSDTTSDSSGTLGHQMVTLTLNIALSGSSSPNTPPNGLANVIYCPNIPTGDSDSLSGKTIGEILDIVNDNLSIGGTSLLPIGYAFSDLNDIVDKLNKAFDDCNDTDWGLQNLCAPPLQ